MDELDRLLNRVGKRIFAEYYALFADPRIADAEIVERLPHEYTLKSRRSRTSKARRIVREGRAGEALRRIAESERTDAEATSLAVRLLRSF